ncbi:hypothetical protein [Erwinia psidii]|nr:hypothetical protein [Erwinia psidii]
MTRTHSTPADMISETQRHYQVGYVSIRHESGKDISAMYYYAAPAYI